MPVLPLLPSPIFTLSVYAEADEFKSVYCLHDPACVEHREMVLLLLRRALFALDHPEVMPSRADGLRSRCSHKRGRFSKA